MQRFFIADIHLNDNEPDILAGFLRFLMQLPDDSELYILGDLFDYWLGDDALSPLEKTVANALATLKSRHIHTYFIHGNRDFLLGKRFAKQSHMRLLTEISVLNSNNNLLILHGDLLCSDDEAYQTFRRKMHNKVLQKLFLLLPRYFRKKIANKLRSESKRQNNSKSKQIMDVNQNTVEDVIRHYQADIMIHGHTHKPALHHFVVDDRPVKRMVLGAWHDGISYIHQDENGEIHLQQL